MGPRLPPRLSRPRRAAGEPRRRSAHRADRDRRCRDAARDREQALHPLAHGLRARLRPPQHQARDAAQAQRHAAIAGLPRRTGRAERHRLLRLAQAHRNPGRGVERERLSRRSLSRRDGEGRPQRQPGSLPARGRGGGDGDGRLRHGHRQARRPLRLPRRHAADDRELLPGDRPRRPRRAASGDADALRARRHAAPAHADRGRRGARRRRSASSINA